MTVYVSTDRVFSEPILREYEKVSGVKVNAVYDTEETKSTGLANRLLAEKARPQADVLKMGDFFRRLKANGVRVVDGSSFKPMTLDYAKAASRVEDVTARLATILGL